MATNLTPQQELFCKLYSTDRNFFGNGVQAYIEAYDIDLSVKGAYSNAKASASRLLTNDNLLKEIRKQMKLGDFTDERVDRELQFLIEQYAELSTKLGAIREYNKLKQRIEDKINYTGMIKQGTAEELQEYKANLQKGDVSEDTEI